MGPGNPEQPLIRSSRSPKVIGVAASLAAVALVYLVWWISDRLVFIRPVDRATFGWLVASRYGRWLRSWPRMRGGLSKPRSSPLRPPR
jgi:hypothetical protein